MTEDDVRRIIREEIDRARYLAPVQIAPVGGPMRPERPTYEPILPLPMPPYWYQPATCVSGSSAFASDDATKANTTA